jgi:hypothetical protein
LETLPDRGNQFERFARWARVVSNPSALFMKQVTPIQATVDQERVLWRLFLLIPLLCLFSSCAANKNLQPAAATPDEEGGFELADRDHNGKLSKAEASDFLVDEIFNSKDTNHDGTVSKEEGTVGDPTAAREFAKRDANHDGVVTKDEAIAYGRKHGLAAKAFKEADKNGDGQLTSQEVQAYYASKEGPPR